MGVPDRLAASGCAFNVFQVSGVSFVSERGLESTKERAGPPARSSWRQLALVPVRYCVCSIVQVNAGSASGMLSAFTTAQT
jgi:hypothetical protein